ASHAPSDWNEAEASARAAEAAFARESYAEAIRIFDQGTRLFRQAQDRAREVVRALEVARVNAEKRRAEEVRSRATEGQGAAAASDAEHYAPALWNEAAGKMAEAQSALEQEQYPTAAVAFSGAWELYRQAAQQAQETRRRQREQAEHGRQAMAAGRRSALAADATSHAPSDWSEA